MVRAYVELVSGSDSFVYWEGELAHAKDEIRAALRLCARWEDDPDARTQLRLLYGLLEDFLPDEKWRLLERWNRAVKQHDYQGVMRAGAPASELLQQLAERRRRREEEFEKFLARGTDGSSDGWDDRPRSAG